MTSSTAKKPAPVLVEAPKRMSLTTVRSSRKVSPDRCLLVGVEGVGKSTFGADSPNPIFLASEDGLHHLDVPMFPQPENYADVLAAITQLRNEAHAYRTLVVDTVDWLEPIIWQHLCDKHDWSNLESPGYGKGFVLATEVWREFLAELGALREARGMEIILLAHAAIKNFSNPAGADYSRYECKLHKGAAALIKEWTDSNLFAIHEEFAVTKKDRKGAEKPTNKAVSTGKRVIKTERTAAWDAKNRYGLPPELPLSYEAYAEARKAGAPAAASVLLVEIKDLFAYVPEAKREATEAYLQEIKDNPTELAKVLNRLRGLASQEGAE